MHVFAPILQCQQSEEHVAVVGEVGHRLRYLVGSQGFAGASLTSSAIEESCRFRRGLAVYGG
jgi:hypothetical protein